MTEKLTRRGFLGGVGTAVVVVPVVMSGGLPAAEPKMMYGSTHVVGAKSGLVTMTTSLGFIPRTSIRGRRIALTSTGGIATIKK